jgi:hypothetical protein
MGAPKQAAALRAPPLNERQTKTHLMQLQDLLALPFDDLLTLLAEAADLRRHKHTVAEAWLVGERRAWE